MLNDYEKGHIYRHAYLPEHLVGYVGSIHNAQPHLMDNYLCFTRNGHLLFVGYPLNRAMPSDAHHTFQKAVSTYKPATATVVTDTIGHAEEAVAIEPVNNSCFLPFPLPATPASLDDLIRQARQEVHLSICPFGRAHQNLIDKFCTLNNVSSRKQKIYQRIGNYCHTSSTAMLLQATQGEKLVAFSVIDFGSAHHAFYQFHIHSAALHVPGCSDLLFDKILYHAQAQGKYGLYIGSGALAHIDRLYQKWGGRPYFFHHAVHLRLKTSVVQKLLETLNLGSPHYLFRP